MYIFVYKLFGLDIVNVCWKRGKRATNKLNLFYPDMPNMTKHTKKFQKLCDDIKTKKIEVRKTVFQNVRKQISIVL